MIPHPRSVMGVESIEVPECVQKSWIVRLRKYLYAQT